MDNGVAFDSTCGITPMTNRQYTRLTDDVNRLNTEIMESQGKVTLTRRNDRC